MVTIYFFVNLYIKSNIPSSGNVICHDIQKLLRKGKDKRKQIKNNKWILILTTTQCCRIAQNVTFKIRFQKMLIGNTSNDLK